MSSVALGSDVDERAWWREHPDPQVTRSEDRLVLWNYPVAGTKLAPEHAAAIRSFLSILLLSPAETGSTVSITGHASTTGEASANEAFALERGENVANYLRGLGFRNLEVTAAGSSEPADPAPSGQALARNRRVEVTLYYQRIEPPPRLDPNEPLPPAGASPPSGASMYFEAGFDIPLGELDNGTVAAAFSIAGTAKFKVTRGDPQAAAGIVLSGDGLSAEFEAKLRDDLNAKLAIEPGGAGEVPTAKVSLDGEVWGFPTEVGFQTKINFLFAEVTFATLKLPDVELENGTTLSLEIEGKFVVEWGASKVVLARAGLAAAAAAEG